MVVDDLETFERAIRIVEQEINRDTSNDAGATLRTGRGLLGLLEPKFRDLLITSSFENRDFLHYEMRSPNERGSPAKRAKLERRGEYAIRNGDGL